MEDGLKISELNQTTTINDSDLIPIVQGNETKSITKEDLVADINTDIDNINNLIDRNSTYSTTEQVIGTWVDGKPIYRKIVYISSLPNATQGSYDTGVSNPEQCVNCYGYATNGLALNLYRYGQEESGLGCWYDTEQNKIKVQTGSDRSSVDAYVTIEYTKTTD